MGQPLQELLENWADGVNTSAASDMVPPTASPRGYNSALTLIGAGRAAVTKRRGCSVMNATALTGTPAILGQFMYRRLASGVFTQYHLLIGDSGRFEWMNTSGTLTTIGASTFSSGTYYPDFAVANNLAFIVNGQDAKKFNGTAAQTFGIVEPSTAPTLADNGGAGSHNGTYEAKVTFYNSATGHESSAGATSGTVTVTNKKIDWTAIPTSADSQVDSRRLYLRNTATQANFYRVTTISDNSTTTYTSNVADTSLTVIGPDTEE